MKFKSIKIKNFLGIKSAKLELKDRGLVLVTGRNLDNPSLSSNGSGKSSLWDALVWCLYGKPVREQIQAGEVVNRWTKERCSVKLTLEDDKGRSWKIYRTRDKKHSDTILTCEGKEVSKNTSSQTQERIDQLLGLDYNTFVSAVLFGQETLRFARLTDKSKKEILERLLGIEKYEEACRRSRQGIQAGKLTLDMSKASYSNAKTRVQESKKELKKCKRELKEEKKARKVNRKKLIKKLSLLKKSIKLNVLEKEKLEGKREKFKKKQEALDKVNNQISEIEESYADTNEEIRELHEESNKIKDRETKTCPLCSQAVGQKERKLVLADYARKIKEKAGSLGDLAKQQRRCIRERKRLKRIVRSRRGKKILNALHYNSESLRALEEERGSVKAALDLAKAQTGSTIRHLKTLRKSYAQAKRDMAKVNEDASKIERKIARYKFWEKGFSATGLRSYLLDNVIPFLNDRAKFYSSILTDGAIKIDFSTKTDLKSGSSAEKFSVKIQNRDGALSYGGNSAGERQRIDVCVALALKDLARTRSRGQIDLMVFDEVFERLDESGCDKIVELLNREKKAWGSCFVITHNESLKQYFSKRLELVKEKGLCRLSEN